MPEENHSLYKCGITLRNCLKYEQGHYQDLERFHLNKYKRIKDYLNLLGINLEKLYFED